MNFAVFKMLLRLLDKCIFPNLAYDKSDRLLNLENQNDVKRSAIKAGNLLL